MNEIIQKLQSLIVSARQSFNQAIKAMPPIEQFEASSEVSYLLRQMKGSGDYLKETFESFDTQLVSLQAKVDEYITSQVAAGVETTLQARLADGSLIKKDDAEANLQAALQVREATVRAEIKKIRDRRAELATGEGAITPEVASLLSDAALAADDFKVRATKAATRVKELNDLGITIPHVLAEAANLPADEAGDAAFTDRAAAFRAVAAKHGTPPPAPSLSGGGLSQSGTATGVPCVAM